jgi:hypothetical protein
MLAHAFFHEQTGPSFHPPAISFIPLHLSIAMPHTSCVQCHKWYCGMAVFSELGVARLRGIAP